MMLLPPTFPRLRERTGLGVVGLRPLGLVLVAPSELRAVLAMLDELEAALRAVSPALLAPPRGANPDNAAESQRVAMVRALRARLGVPEDAGAMLDQATAVAIEALARLDAHRFTPGGPNVGGAVRRAASDTDD